MTTILGSAEKTFGELEFNDKLYYIDPKTPETISELTIKEVTPYPEKKHWVLVHYFQSSEALEIVTLEQSFMVPTKQILVESKATRVVTLSTPPTIYFTNKLSLERFMGKRK